MLCIVVSHKPSPSFHSMFKSGTLETELIPTDQPISPSSSAPTGNSAETRPSWSGRLVIRWKVRIIDPQWIQSKSNALIVRKQVSGSPWPHKTRSRRRISRMAWATLGPSMAPKASRWFCLGMWRVGRRSSYLGIIMMGCICVPVKMRSKSGKLGRTCQGLSNLHDLVGTGTFEIHQSCWYYRLLRPGPLRN